MTTVLVTGSSGYIGQQLVTELASQVGKGQLRGVIACDVKRPDALPTHATWVEHDVRRPTLATLLATHKVDVVVHLAGIVTPPPGSRRDFAYSVDVEGTRNVLDACVVAGVRRVVVTSSGAAYGYHPDNPTRLAETDAIRGNKSFAYSWHKRLTEEMLVDYRRAYPRLEQVIFRMGTVLGASVNNQITALFERPRLIAINGSDSPFVFVHDRDVVGCLVRAIDSSVTGIFNVAGDGAVTIDEIAAVLGKPVRRLPAWLLQRVLALLHPLGIVPYGPEQVDFLRYRPVLDNTRLKKEFGYTPALTSLQVLELWRDARRR